MTLKRASSGPLSFSLYVLMLTSVVFLLIELYWLHLDPSAAWKTSACIITIKQLLHAQSFSSGWEFATVEGHECYLAAIIVKFLYHTSPTSAYKDGCCCSGEWSATISSIILLNSYIAAGMCYFNTNMGAVTYQLHDCMHTFCMHTFFVLHFLSHFHILS